jgi:hypothetical protein
VNSLVVPQGEEHACERTDGTDKSADKWMQELFHEYLATSMVTYGWNAKRGSRWVNHFVLHFLR